MRHHDELNLATRPAYAAAVRRALRPEVSGKLSPAAYETLAIVAYQQPVPRSRIEEVRGVNCESVLTNLELRDLITEVGRGSGPGLPMLYGTTMRFLQVMGLESLDHLPTPRLERAEVGPSTDGTSDPEQLTGGVRRGKASGRPPHTGGVPRLANGSIASSQGQAWPAAARPTS